MEPEDRLDALLAARERRRPTSDVSPRGERPDELLAPLVAAANRLGELRRAEPAPDFAHRLGEQLRARTDHMRHVPAMGTEAGQGRPESRSEGRDGGTRSLGGTSVAPADGARRPATPIPLRSRALRPALVAAAVLLLAFGGVTTYAAAAQVGPGNPLYFVHRQVQSVQAELAGSQADRTRLHLEYATEALQQLDAAAQRHDDGSYATALQTLNTELSAANQALASVPAGSDHDALAGQLNALQSHARQDLAADLAVINWDNRLSTTATLGSMGVGVPHVNTATVVRQGDQQSDQQSDGHDGARASGQHGDQITVSGSGFASGAALVVDGHVAPVVTISVGPTQLVAVVADDAAEHAHSIGVSNPDGTAAQTTNISVQNVPGSGGDGSGDGGDKHPTPTPTPTPTATPGHDHGH